MDPGLSGGCWSGRTAEQSPAVRMTAPPRPESQVRSTTPDPCAYIPAGGLHKHSTQPQRPARLSRLFPSRPVSVRTSALTLSLVSCLVQTYDCPPDDTAVLPHDAVSLPCVLGWAPLTHTQLLGYLGKLALWGTCEVTHTHTHKDI